MVNGKWCILDKGHMEQDFALHFVESNNEFFVQQLYRRSRNIITSNCFVKGKTTIGNNDKSRDRDDVYSFQSPSVDICPESGRHY